MQTSMKSHPLMVMCIGWVLEYVILPWETLEHNLHLVHMIMPQVGVSELEPKPCPRFIFRRGLLHGTTDLTALEFRVLLANAQMSIVGTHTHALIARNYNHFSDDVCQWLMGSSIPWWINSLVQTGYFRNCLFTEGVQVTMMKLLSFQMGENTRNRWWEVRVIKSTPELITISPMPISPTYCLSWDSYGFLFSHLGNLVVWDSVNMYSY